MKKVKKTGYAIGLAILGFIIYLTIHQTIGLTLLVIGLAALIVFNFIPSKKKEQNETQGFEQERPVSEGEIEENDDDDNNDDDNDDEDDD
ncbi:MAG: hypothetical protein WC283_03680 [Candidatus Paceibacterota bacterium]|jgi:hypothetical protein